MRAARASGIELSPAVIAALGAAADELIKARGELMKLEIGNKLKAKAILGDELVKKLREMGPPQGMERPGRGPRGEGCDRPQPREQK